MNMTADQAQRFEYYSATNAGIVKACLPCGCKPYEDVFTYARWQALGYQVKKGEHGIKIGTYAPITQKDEDGEKIVGKRPWTSTVFCRCQVKPK